jgi:hypothetical protein
MDALAPIRNSTPILVFAPLSFSMSRKIYRGLSTSFLPYLIAGSCVNEFIRERSGETLARTFQLCLTTRSLLHMPGSMNSVRKEMPLKSFQPNLLHYTPQIWIEALGSWAIFAQDPPTEFGANQQALTALHGKLRFCDVLQGCFGGAIFYCLMITRLDDVQKSHPYASYTKLNSWIMSMTCKREPWSRGTNELLLLPPCFGPISKRGFLCNSFAHRNVNVQVIVESWNPSRLSTSSNSLSAKSHYIFKLRC